MKRSNSNKLYRPGLCGLMLLASALLVTILAQRRLSAAPQDRPRTTLERTPNAEGRLQVIDLYAKRPLSFERNDGQTDAKVKFISRGDGYTLFLSPAEAVLALRTTGKESGQTQKFESETLRIQLVGANPSAQIEGVDQLAGRSNYFAGRDPRKWHTNIPTYARVRYGNVYSGIDLVYYGASQRQLEYDFVVAPGADPKLIGLRFEGARAMTVNRDGDLILHLAGGSEVVHHAPVIYQERDGKRETVHGNSVLRARIPSVSSWRRMTTRAPYLSIQG
ncbi:MAG TPA: hypothetical protein VEY94_02010 [Patescibacteria group bacterium]|nr:hypothetical protein [Patescibacteria group bacterium]